MSTLRISAGWMLLGFSLLLQVFTVYAYSRQPDFLALCTVLPIWLWGGLGLLLSSFAYCCLRSWFSLGMIAVWVTTLLVGADEARTLTHLRKESPQPGRAAAHGKNSVMRVITFNCAHFRYGDPSQDIAAWQPDIVLLQDAYPHQVLRIAQVLYGHSGSYRAGQTTGIVTRWEIKRELLNPQHRSLQTTVKLPDGRILEVVNLHLLSATTNLRFWQRSAWREHMNNRAQRIKELSTALKNLEKTTPFPKNPTLLGGDFNAGANDIIHQPLSGSFVNAYAATGTGCGNTYHQRLPLLRIDHLYATRHFTPARSRAVRTRHSDHRMVVADFVFRENKRLARESP